MSAENVSQSQPRPSARQLVSARLRGHWLLRDPFTVHFYRYPMLWLLLAMLGGNWGRTLITPSGFSLMLILLPLLLVISSVIGRMNYRRLAGVLSLLAAAIFAAVYGYLFQPQTEDSLSAFAQRKPQPITLRAVINSVAEWQPNLNHRPQDASSEPWQTRWEIECESVRDGTHWIPVMVRTTLMVEGRVDDLLPGDEIEIYGSYRSINPPTNPGAFDFSERARQDSQFLRVSADNRGQIKWLGQRKSHPLLRTRGLAVRTIDRYLQRWITHDQAPLAAALIFGQRGQVDWQGRQELMATGTLHLLAISGLHVGIIAGVILLVCSILQVRNTTGCVWVCVVCSLYAALAGGQPPVLRAVVLISLFALARVWGRRTRLINLLSVAAIALLLIQATNVSEVGVHLSFLAVGSMGVFGGFHHAQAERRSALQAVVEESYGRWHRGWLRWRRRTLAAIQLSFWVWLMTCPLIWVNFHIIAPIAIPLNVLLAIPLVVSLLGGLCVSAFGWLTPVAWLCGQISGAGLALISWLVSCGSDLPLGHFWLPAPPRFWVICFYALTVVWLLVLGQRRRGWLGMLLCLWLAVGASWFSLGPRGYLLPGASATGFVPVLQPTPPAADLRLTFLDVGHGTSVIIEFPSGGVWLYDAGHFGATESSHQDIATALWSLPTARIDHLVISHADADHYNATMGLLERFNVGRVVSTKRFWQSTSWEVEKVHEAIDGRGVERIEWSVDHQGSLGGVAWQILHPADSLASESDNSSSLCMLLEYAGKRILLPGDLEGSGLLSLVALPERPCHALMAPHHGSLSHDPAELLSWCQPEVVVISGNHRAIRPQVIEQYARPDTTLGITFRDGAIQVRISATGELSSWHWQQDAWLRLPRTQFPLPSEALRGL